MTRHLTYHEQTLDFSAHLDRHDVPYRWAVAHDFVPREVRDQVRAQVPPLGEQWRAARHHGGDKNYGMFVMPLLARSDPLPALDGQPEILRRLVRDLSGERYRAWVLEALGVSVEDCLVDIGVFHFRDSDYITPHTDKVGKLATHVLYFNESEWLREFGGLFEVRAGDDVSGPPVAAVEPSGGRSVLFARSARSWHSVSPIRAPLGIVRWTMQVEMWDRARS